uniref:Uncharacterized protein n=1 Tax=Magallana gigas TaxID=29159 RepID=A0A8W8HUJ0_MAGGI
MWKLTIPIKRNSSRLPFRFQPTSPFYARAFVPDQSRIAGLGFVTVQIGGYRPALFAIQKHGIFSKKDGKGTPPLVTAVNTGNLEICRYLLENGAKIDATDRRLKRSALQYAILAKNLDIFDLLLKYNPSLDQGDYRGKTALHRICAIKDPRYFQRVIKHYGTFPDHIMEQETDDGVTPVISACQSGNSQQLKELIDQGAPISTKDDNGRTALHYCADNLETQCAEMLLAKDPSLLEVKDSQGFTPLHMSVISGNVPLLKLLLAKGADIRSLDSELHTPTHWATVCGHLEILDILIDNGAELSSADSHNAYPIHYAAQMNGKDSNHADSKVGEKVLKKLLDSGVPHDVTDKDGRQPLLWAASAGNTESIKLLVKAGADVNAIDKDGLSALHCAASRGHSHCIEELKKLGADVNLADKNSCTPLFYAVTLGNKDCTKTLLKHGADPNHQDVRGRTPSHCASVKGCVETLKILDKSKADLWGSSGRGDFPIHEAAQGGHCDVVKYLLKWKNTPDAVNTPNNAGRTCLHISAIINNLPLCKLLLDNGAEKNSLMMHKNKKDSSKDKSYTPYDAAILKDNRETAEYIKSKGGNTGGDIDNILNKKDKRESKSAKSRKSNLESHKEEEENAEQDKKSEKQEETDKEEKPKSKKELEKEKKEAEKAKKEEEKKKKEEELKTKKEEEQKKKEEEKKQKEEEKKKKEEEKKQKEEEKKQKEEEKKQKEQESKTSPEETTDKKEEAVVAAAAAVVADEKEKKEEDKKGKKDSSKEDKNSKEGKGSKEVKDNNEKEQEKKKKEKEQKDPEKEDQLESDEEVVVVKGKKVVRKKKGYVKDKEAEKARKEAEEAKKDAVKANQEAEKAKANAEKAKLEKEQQDQKKKKSAKEKKEEKVESNKAKDKDKTKKDEKAVASAALAAKNKKGKKDPDTIQEEDEEEEDDTIKESPIEAEKAKRETEKSKKEAEKLRKEAEKANSEADKIKQAAVVAETTEEDTKPEESQKEKSAPATPKTPNKDVKEPDKDKDEEPEKEKSTVSKSDKSKKSSEQPKVDKEKTSPELKEVDKTQKKDSQRKLQQEVEDQRQTSEKQTLEENFIEDKVDADDEIDEREDSGVNTPGSLAEEEDLEKHLVAANIAAESEKGKKKNKSTNQPGPSTSTPKTKHRPKKEDNNKQKVSPKDSGKPISRERTEFQEVELVTNRDSGNHSQSEDRHSQTEDRHSQTEDRHSQTEGRQSQTKHNLVLSPSLSPVDYQEHKKDAFVETPKSRSAHTEKQDDEDEFEFPENSHENQEAALRLAESRKQSRQETVPDSSRPSDSPDRESRSRRKASKIPDTEVIQPGLKSRDNSRSKTPVLTNGHTQQNKDYVETSEEDDDVITEINFQNRLRRIEKAQLARNKQKEQFLLQQLRKTQKPNYKLAPVRSKNKSNLSLADMERLDNSGRRRNVPRRVASIQESVRRYQDQRRFVRQMHQLKRAQIYTGPMHDIVLFSKMMDVYKHSTPGGSENDLEMSTMDNWDSYLRDQLRFVSHYYDEDKSVRDQTNKVRRETADTRRGVESRSEYLAQSFRRKEEQDGREKTDLDGRISTLTRKTEDLYDSVKEKADQTLQDAKETNASLDKYYRKERSDLLHHSRPHSHKKLKDEEEMDERHRMHEEHEKARKEKHSEWHRKKDEELRRRLLKVYGNGSEINYGKSRNVGHMKSSTPRTNNSVGTSPGSRPKSMMSSTSGSRAQYSNSTDQELSVQMTEFGFRRVKKTDDGSYVPCSRHGSNWTPKFDGDVRPRAGLVFVEPKLYNEYLKEEAQVRHQTAMMARSRSTNINTLEDDATVLETVET